MGCRALTPCIVFLAGILALTASADEYHLYRPEKVEAQNAPASPEEIGRAHV